jgi:hypothetical protein
MALTEQAKGEGFTNHNQRADSNPKGLTRLLQSGFVEIQTSRYARQDFLFNTKVQELKQITNSVSNRKDLYEYITQRTKNEI